MNVVITFSCILFFHQLYVTMRNRKMYKNGGDIIEVYEHKSFLRKTLMMIMFLAISFTIWAFGTMGSVAVICIPMLAYSVLMFYNHSNKIQLLEAGLFLNGRFFNWSSIERVDVDGGALKLTLQGDQYKVYVVDNVTEIGRLKTAVLTRMKYSKTK